MNQLFVDTLRLLNYVNMRLASLVLDLLTSLNYH